MFTRRTLFGAGAMLATSTLATGQDHLPQACKSEPTFCWSNIPEYMWGAPERTSFIEPGLETQRLNVTSRLLDRLCRPVAGARIEFWHTDPQGEYDYRTFRFRGLQRTSADGTYQLETIMPGYYSPRSHIHYLVGVKREGGSGLLLTNSIGLPTQEEFKSGRLRAAEGDVCDPRSFVRNGEKLSTRFDIVADT